MKKIILIASAFAVALSFSGAVAKSAFAQAPFDICSVTSFTTSATTVSSGSTVDLKWVVDNSNCDTVKITDAAGKVIKSTPSTAGTFTTAALTATQTFTLSASKTFLPTIAKKSVTVTVTPAPVVCAITSFTATPKTVPVGGSSALAWNTAGCTSVTLSGGSLSGAKALSSSGTTTGAVLTPTTYTLTATGKTGSTTATTLVSVTATTPCPSSSLGGRDVLHGYAWSSTIGWISLNCAEGGLTGFSDYKVAVSPTTGAFSGHAWSDNIGWVSFESADVTAQCGPVASIDFSTNKVSGWARTVSGSKASGADGCISLASIGGPSYGLKYDPSSTTPIAVGGKTMAGHTLSGFAWGSVNTGWVSFNYATLDSTYSSGVTIDLKVNGSDGPYTTTDETGGPVTLSWVSGSATSCVAVPDTFDPSETYWSGSKSLSGSLGITVPANTSSTTISHVYGITCTGAAGSTTDTVQVDVPGLDEVTASVTVDVISSGPPTPIVVLKVDGVDAETVPSGTPVTLTWSTQGIQTGSCITSSSLPNMVWNGTPIITSITNTPAYGSLVTAPIMTSQSFTISGCLPDGGGAPVSYAYLTTPLAPVTVTVTVDDDGTGTGGTGGTVRPPWKER